MTTIRMHAAPRASPSFDAARDHHHFECANVFGCANMMDRRTNEDYTAA